MPQLIRPSAVSQIRARASVLGHHAALVLHAYIDSDPERWEYAEFGELRDACVATLAAPPVETGGPFDLYAMAVPSFKDPVIARLVAA